MAPRETQCKKQLLPACSALSALLEGKFEGELMFLRFSYFSIVGFVHFCRFLLCLGGNG